MKLTTLGAVALTVGALSTMPVRGGAQGRDDSDRFNININVQYDGPITSCDQIEATVRGAYLARGEDTVQVPLTGNMLKVSSSQNGGLIVQGASRADYEVRLCKFAAGASMADAAARLDQVKLSVQQGLVTATGPNGHGWRAEVLVQAPPDARLAVDAHNGPLSVRSTSGQLTARTLNGPLSLREVSGEVQADAQNGPLAVVDASGSIKATAMNGPLSVKLSGSSWSGTGLDARVENGPLSLRLPPSYNSGVQVNLGNHGPFACKVAACQSAMRQWDDQGRQLQFGEGATAVRISAKNGPVDIR
jgi:hypothetical protein